MISQGRDPNSPISKILLNFPHISFLFYKLPQIASQATLVENQHLPKLLTDSDLLYFINAIRVLIQILLGNNTALARLDGSKGI